MNTDYNAAIDAMDQSARGAVFAGSQVRRIGQLQKRRSNVLKGSRLEQTSAVRSVLFHRNRSAMGEPVRSGISKAHWIQKQKLKRVYASEFRPGAISKTAAAQTAGVRTPLVTRLRKTVLEFPQRHRTGLKVILAIVLALTVLLSSLGTVSSVVSEMGEAIVRTTYLAADDEMKAVERYYKELEAKLQAQIDRTERDYPGYDDYRYQVDEISHNPYQLISYFTAKHGSFKFKDLKAEIEEIFREQYGITQRGEVVTETVKKSVGVGESLGNVVTTGYCNCVKCCGKWAGGPTASGAYPTAEHTIAVDAKNPFVPMGTHVIMNGKEYVVEDTGNFARYGVQFDVYYSNHTSASLHGQQTWEAYLADGNSSNTIEVTTTQTVNRLSTMMTSGNLDAILKSRLNENQKEQYEIYNSCYGNRQDLFDLSSLPLPRGGQYMIPREALSDSRFAKMINEAEKYLGMPYVWGGESPSTSFDCSGFVSWVINHSDNGWNYGRLTAEGLRTITSYVNPTDLKEALPEQYQNAKIEIGDVERINGKYTNLVVKTENEEDLHVLPSINLDDFYMVYLQGTELEDVLSSIAETVQHETPEIPLDMFSNYQEAKQHLFVRVMDAETNRDLLKTVPHQMEANLALTYHIQIDLSDGQTGNTIVTNRMMNQFHLTQEQLHQDAMENSQKLYPATLDSMRDMMEELMETSGNAAPDLAEDTPPDMLVVSNGPRVYGASALFYPDQMDQIADAMGGSYYIIPSSIHETLILPDQGVPQGNELNAMIREVNETQVLPKDRLANEAFHYDEQEHVFEPAISYEARQAEKQMNRSERGASRSIREQLEEKKSEIGNRPKKEHPVKHTPERGELV